jgi:asparagine synthetase B (glutamine-hydrolysing)
VVDFVAWQRRDYATPTSSRDRDAASASFAWVDADRGLDAAAVLVASPARRASASEVDAETAARELRGLLDDATRLRLRADVPAAVQDQRRLGLLRGSLPLRRNHARRILAFTVSFRDPREDEEPFARAAADRYRGQVDYHVFEPPMTTS